MITAQARQLIGSKKYSEVLIQSDKIARLYFLGHRSVVLHFLWIPLLAAYSPLQKKFQLLLLVALWVVSPSPLMTTALIISSTELLGMLVGDTGLGEDQKKWLLFGLCRHFHTGVAQMPPQHHTFILLIQVCSENSTQHFRKAHLCNTLSKFPYTVLLMPS